MARKTKRAVIISDLHCGHMMGLTPPSWQFKINEQSSAGIRELSRIHNELWGFFDKTIKKLQPIDVLIVNGDCIDGKGEKSGGTEIITADRSTQSEMATECIERTKAKNIVMTYGTPYHVGKNEDWEKLIANNVKATKIGGHEWIQLNGVLFDVKHHVGSSSIPHGRHTAVSREHMWNVLWAEHGGAPRSNIIIRSHVHYHNFCGGNGWMGMTTPALQGLGSKYGTRRCSGIVDFGLVHFDINPSGQYTWYSHIMKIIDDNKVINI